MRLFQHRVALLSACLPMAIAVTACNQPPAAPPASSAPAAAVAPASTTTPVEHGKMLVIGGGCHDCHTPMKPGPNGAEPDMAKMLSGHPESISITAPMKPVGPWLVATNATNTAWSGPWGVSFAANLTPPSWVTTIGGRPTAAVIAFSVACGRNILSDHIVV